MKYHSLTQPSIPNAITVPVPATSNAIAGPSTTGAAAGVVNNEEGSMVYDEDAKGDEDVDAEAEADAEGQMQGVDE